MDRVPYIAIAAAFVLIYLPRYLVTLEMRKLEGGYNNRDPRGQQAHLEGLGRRALAAHQNAHEAFPPFTAGTFAAMQRSGELDVIAWIGLAFVAVRTVYMFAYLGDKATLRSTMWGCGMVCIATLMVMAIIG